MSAPHEKNISYKLQKTLIYLPAAHVKELIGFSPLPSDGEPIWLRKYHYYICRLWLQFDDSYLNYLSLRLLITHHGVIEKCSLQMESTDRFLYSVFKGHFSLH